MAYLDNNGLAHFWDKIKDYVGENSGGSHVHTSYSATKSVAITSSNPIDGTPAAGASLTLPPGRYILIGRAYFNSVSSAERNIGLAFYTGSSPTNGTIIGQSMVRVYLPHSWWTSLVTAALVEPTATTVYTAGLVASVASSGNGTYLYAVSLPSANSSGTQASHIGQIVQSTTLDTMEKVIEVYGGTTWIRHDGYMLRGASSGVTSNSASSDGGAETVTLTVNEMPPHTHVQNSHNHTQNAHSHTMTNKYTSGQIASGSNTPRFRTDGSTSTTNFTSCGGTTATNNPTTATNQNTGGGQAHNNMPPYKNVYIWERTA